MATSSTYYLNAPSLESATAVFTDDALSICAADGFYSDGVISREQVGCVLLPQQSCPSCAVPCDQTVNLTAGNGIYSLDLNTGDTVSDIGAVIIRFNPQSIPSGIKATLGTIVYNKLTSPLDGFHKTSISQDLTYIGATASDCGISGATFNSLIKYKYNGGNFIPTGSTQTITIPAGSVSLSSSDPGNCMIVVPKTTPYPSIINFQLIGPCQNTSWNLLTNCPELLTGFSSSVVAESSELVCDLPQTVTYYNASLADTPGIVGLYDFVYYDSYGASPLLIGYYHSLSIVGANNWFRVDANGIVVELGLCPAVLCGNSITASGAQGVYSTEIEAGVDVGAIIIRFDPIDVPDGILGELGGTSYNKLTSPFDGLHQSSFSGVQPTYVGNSGDDCDLVANSPYTLTVFEFDGTNYNDTGTTQNISVFQQQLSLTSNNQPGNCMMVIPKTIASPSLVTVTVIGICGNTQFNLDINCPVLLTGFISSLVKQNINDVCSATEDQTYYNASLANTPGTVGLYDFVYSDEYGVTKLSDGFYSSPNIFGSKDYFEVDNGVVIALNICPAVTWNCDNGICTAIYDGLGLYPTLNDCEAACFAPTWECLNGVCIEKFDGSGAYTTLNDCETNCVPPPPPATWNCINGTCVDPGDGSGVYLTLNDCEVACFASTWECSGGICIEKFDGSGAYGSLSACQAACFASTWDCLNGVCTEKFDGSGAYGSLSACQANCLGPNQFTDTNGPGRMYVNSTMGSGSWSLVLQGGGTVFSLDPYNTSYNNPGFGPNYWSEVKMAGGFSTASVVSFKIVSSNTPSGGIASFAQSMKITDGTNIYTGQDTRTANNEVTVSFTIGTAQGRTFSWAIGFLELDIEDNNQSFNCVNGTCVDPGGGGGTYLTLNACQLNCATPPPYNYYTLTSCSGGAGTNYRSQLSLALNSVYSFAAYPPSVSCFQITSITAPTNTNDLPSIYGPLGSCIDVNCIQE